MKSILDTVKSTLESISKMITSTEPTMPLPPSTKAAIYQKVDIAQRALEDYEKSGTAEVINKLLMDNHRLTKDIDNLRYALRNEIVTKLLTYELGKCQKMAVKEYESGEFCDSINCRQPKAVCKYCVAYLFHKYLQEHGQIKDKEDLKRDKSKPIHYAENFLEHELETLVKTESEQLIELSPEASNDDANLAAISKAKNPEPPVIRLSDLCRGIHCECYDYKLPGCCSAYDWEPYDCGPQNALRWLDRRGIIKFKGGEKPNGK